jgi:hypothetical protein
MPLLSGFVVPKPLVQLADQVESSFPAKLQTSAGQPSLSRQPLINLDVGPSSTSASGMNVMVPSLGKAANEVIHSISHEVAKATVDSLMAEQKMSPIKENVGDVVGGVRDVRRQIGTKPSTRAACTGEHLDQSDINAIGGVVEQRGVGDISAQGDGCTQDLGRLHLNLGDTKATTMSGGGSLWEPRMVLK